MALLLIATSKISVAITFPSAIGLITAVASAIMSSDTVSSGFVVSFTVIFCVPVLTFPFSSVAVQIIFVSPRANVSGASFTISTSNISVASKTPISTVDLMAFASTVLSTGTTISGFVVSVTIILTS